MILIKTAKKQILKLSKIEWQNIGEKAKWIKKSQIIPDDGFADGGTAYTDEEMLLMEIQKIKTNADRPSKIKQIMDLYVDMNPKASGYELNTLWNDISQMPTEEINQYINKYVSKWTRKRIN